MLIFQRECDWCGAVEDLKRPLSSTTWGTAHVVRPKDWVTRRSPFDNQWIDVCEACIPKFKEAVDQANEAAEAARHGILKNLKPRVPRQQSDKKMREAERKKASE